MGKRRLSLIEQAFNEYHSSKMQECHEEDGYWLPRSENNQALVKVKIEELNAFQLDFVQNRLNKRRDQIRRISANDPTCILSNEKKRSVRAQNESRSQRDRDGDMIMEAAKPAFDPSKWITKPASFDGSNKKQAKEFLQKTEQYFDMIRVVEDGQRVGLFSTMITGAAWNIIDQFKQLMFRSSQRWPTWVETKAEFTLKMGTPREDRFQVATEQLRQNQAERSLEQYFLDFEMARGEYNSVSNTPLAERDAGTKFIANLNHKFN